LVVEESGGRFGVFLCPLPPGSQRSAAAVVAADSASVAHVWLDPDHSAGVAGFRLRAGCRRRFRRRRSWNAAGLVEGGEDRGLARGPVPFDPAAGCRQGRVVGHVAEVAEGADEVREVREVAAVVVPRLVVDQRGLDGYAAGWSVGRRRR
jgi:hypothetical protein